MKKAGEELRRIREEKGYSVLEVSKNTKISVSVLNALEEGRIDNVDPIYLKGFIKMYCRFLGIKWEGFLKEYPMPHRENRYASKPAQQAAPLKDPEVPRPKIQASDVLSLVRPVLSRIKKRMPLILSIIALLLFALLAIRGCALVFKKLSSGASRQKKAEVLPKKSSRAESKQAPLMKTQNPPRAIEAPPPVSAPVPVVKEEKPKEISLVVSAQANSFLTLRADGKLVYQRMLSKGRAESWTARERFELSVGNAGGITLEVNGKVFSALGRKGQALKNIVITHDGLKVQ
jgi:cytoskeletal protein RodZ